MAWVYHNNSAADDTGDGRSWAAAKKTISAALTLAVADGDGTKIFTASTSAETLGASVATGQTQIREQNVRGYYIISANTATGSGQTTEPTYLVGSSITTTASFSFAPPNCYGMSFAQASGAPNLLWNYRVELEDCTFTFGGTNVQMLLGAAGARLMLRNPTFALGAAFTSPKLVVLGYVYIYNPTFTGSAGAGSVPPFQNSATTSLSHHVEIHGANLTLFSDLIRNHSGQGGRGNAGLYRFVRCILPSSFEVEDAQGDFIASNNTVIECIYCSSGTIATEAIDFRRYDGCRGSTRSDAAVYRDAAITKTASTSLAMVAKANQTTKRLAPLRGLPINVRVVAGLSTTLTMHLAHNGVGAGTGGKLQNDQFWVNVAAPDDSDGSIDAAGVAVTSRCTLAGTPADLGASSEAWTGSSIGTKDAVAVTFTPAVDGYATLTPCFAPGLGSNTTVYVCPIVEIS